MDVVKKAFEVKTGLGMEVDCALKPVSMHDNIIRYQSSENEICPLTVVFNTLVTCIFKGISYVSYRTSPVELLHNII